MRKLFKIITATALLLALTSPANAAIQSKAGSASGPAGQTLRVSKIDKLKNGQKVTVTGKGYDQNLGIYVAYCVLPTDGSVPSNCVGGIRKSSSSAWISSNPPVYGKLITKKYKKNGSFSVSIRVTKTIGDVDCKVASCGIVTRADHINSDNRTADIFIPVTFK